MKFLRQSRLYPDSYPAVGLLFLRIFVGYAMAQHGLAKIVGPGGPFGWMGDGAPVPHTLQFLAVLSEFGGGLALIFGALFPLACLGLMCTMVVATLANLGRNQPVIAAGMERSTEITIVYFFIALCLFLTGPGLLAFDYFVFGRKREVAAV